jgi:hypothetical protein
MPHKTKFCFNLNLPRKRFILESPPSVGNNPTRGNSKQATISMMNGTLYWCWKVRSEDENEINHGRKLKLFVNEPYRPGIELFDV